MHPFATSLAVGIKKEHECERDATENWSVGRAFDTRDNATSPPVVLVSEELARQLSRGLILVSACPLLGPGPRGRRARAVWMRETFQIAVCRACRLAGFSRAAWYKKSTARDQSVLRMRIRELAMARPRFGYNRIHTLLRREGWRVNNKRVRRLY